MDVLKDIIVEQALVMYNGVIANEVKRIYTSYYPCLGVYILIFIYRNFNRGSQIWDDQNHLITFEADCII